MRRRTAGARHTGPQADEALTRKANLGQAHVVDASSLPVNPLDRVAQTP